MFCISNEKETIETYLSGAGVSDHVTLWLLLKALPIVQPKQHHFLPHEAGGMCKELKCKAGSCVSCAACHAMSSMDAHLPGLQAKIGLSQTLPRILSLLRMEELIQPGTILKSTARIPSHWPGPSKQAAKSKAVIPASRGASGTRRVVAPVCAPYRHRLPPRHPPLKSADSCVANFTSSFEHTNFLQPGCQSTSLSQTASAAFTDI